MLRSDGAVLRGFRSGGDAVVAAFFPGGSFERIEPLFGSPAELGLRAQAGTAMITVSDHAHTFCPIDDWSAEPSNDSVQGSALALIRGDKVHVKTGAVDWPLHLTLTSDGTCLLAYDVGTGASRVIDVNSGLETQLGHSNAYFFE